MKTFGEKIKELRKEHTLTQEELSKIDDKIKDMFKGDTAH